VRRNVETLRPLANGDGCLNPSGSISVLIAIKNADRVVVSVRRENPALVAADDQHMSAVLPNSQGPIQLGRGGIVSPNHLASFRREVDLAVHHFQSVRRAQGAEVYSRQSLLR